MSSKITLYDSLGNPQELTGDDVVGMGGTPVGTIINYGGVTPPSGFIVCDGTEQLKATYPYLYAAIGDAWGTGSTSDHFVLPNQAQGGLGNFMRGVGAVGVGSYQADVFKSHNHSTAIPKSLNAFIETNHCSVALNTTGFLHLQQ